MGRIEGDLSVLNLADLLQWAELGSRTGTATVRGGGAEKKLYLVAGRLIFVSSCKEGERLGEYLQRGSYVDVEKIKTALSEAQNMKIPFTQRLLKLNYITAAGLRTAASRQAREIVIDACSWTDGKFDFVVDVPPAVLAGPITLDMPVRRLLEDLESAGSLVRRRDVPYFIRAGQR